MMNKFKKQLNQVGDSAISYYSIFKYDFIGQYYQLIKQKISKKKMLNQRKAWTSNEDAILTQIYMTNKIKIESHSLNWNNLAEQFNSHEIGQKRTGKQCRQRWFNQLDPEIKKSEEWSEEEKSKVLKLHNCFGNKWSLIAKNLEGRTDNSVKNFINSNLRKGLRLLNLYISKNKKFSDFRFRNLKEYKTDLLTKILLFSGENETFHDQEYSICFYNSQINKYQVLRKVYYLAKEIKSQLLSVETKYLQSEINLSLRKSYEPVDFFQSIIKNIQQLNILCKKRKQKKSRKEDSLQQKTCKQGYNKQGSQNSLQSLSNDFQKCSKTSQIKTHSRNIQNVVKIQHERSQQIKNNYKVFAQIQSFGQKKTGLGTYQKQKTCQNKEYLFNDKKSKIQKKLQKKNSQLKSNTRNIFSKQCQIKGNMMEMVNQAMRKAEMKSNQKRNSLQNILQASQQAQRHLQIQRIPSLSQANLFFQGAYSPHIIPITTSAYIAEEDDCFLFNEMMEENPPLYPTMHNNVLKTDQFDLLSTDHYYVNRYGHFGEEEEAI